MINPKHFLLTFFLCLLPLFSGCNRSATPAAAPTVVFINISYPGSNAEVVAKTIAVPLEQQLHGVAGLSRMETFSSNNSYVAQLYFDSTTDSATLEELVQERLDIAKPKLPADAQFMSLSVKPPKAALNPTQVSIALLDHKKRNWPIQQKCAAAIQQQLSAANLLQNPTIYPVAEKQLVIMINNDRLTQLGLSKAEVNAALPPDPRDMPIDELRKLTVGDKKIPLSSLVQFSEEVIPTTIYRVNQHPAIRISGTASPGSPVPEAAAKCVEAAEAEIKRGKFKDFAIENLSGN